MTETQVYAHPAKILLPNASIDKKKWAVVACDQYTSSQEYWDGVKTLVGSAPSTLNLVLPEIYLEEADVMDRIQSIKKNMREYIDNGVLTALPPCMVYTRRTTQSGTRHGLIMAIDLEQYDYNRGSTSPIRPTEGTIVERIPPRERIRQGAAIELPHIMLLADDPTDSILGGIKREINRLELLYETTLMMNGGHIKGYMVDEQHIDGINKCIDALYRARKKEYAGTPPILFAVGDGNHSLATAKSCWERLKQTLTGEQASSHPARYALVELVNLHDEALTFEPIHRVLFNMGTNTLLAKLKAAAKSIGVEIDTINQPKDAPEGLSFYLQSGTINRKVRILGHESKLAVGALQSLLDSIDLEGAAIDYIHGGDEAIKLAASPDNTAIILPPMDKHALFPIIMKEGVLPRKTFSMGEADEKRFYLEGRMIV